MQLAIDPSIVDSEEIRERHPQGLTSFASFNRIIEAMKASGEMRKDAVVTGGPATEGSRVRVQQVGENVDTVQERVIRAVNNVLFANEKEIKPESNVVVDLGADSLDQIEIIMAVEDEFNLEISDEDAKKWTTVQDIIAYVKSRTEQ